MNDFESGARELTEGELAAVNGGMWANYDWMNYDWRDAVIDALP
ncbi:hypothetical protein [Actinomadura luzonensis]|nr:hypothetical protein [Actinomadura luzonensis]